MRNVWISRAFTAALMLLLACGLSRAQQSAEPAGPIQDNSFLIEEAYNQEEGVVQHASFFTYLAEAEQWSYGFTQEWPVPGDWRHQFSYTIPVERPGAASRIGLGDVALHYRYQLLGDGGARVAIAPAFTLTLPTGDSERGRGSGAPGYQFNLPLSVAHNDRWVSHWNAGGSITPHAKNELGDEANLKGFNLGASLIYLARRNFNVMLETLWTGDRSVAGPERTEFGHELFISPGIRWAHNLQSGLQIVPGIALALGAGPSSGERAVLFYLSFEHPFRRTR